MLHTDVVNGLHFHYMYRTDTIGLWFNGERIPRYKISCGSRQYFKIGNYFIKADHSASFIGQCENEAHFYRRLRSKDARYFARLLACSDFDSESRLQWTMFPWYNLKRYSENTELFAKCRAKVDNLCEKYDIDDVTPFHGINWFIHKGEPLIVDYGLYYGGS